MSEKINDKIKEIEHVLEKISEIVPLSLEEYRNQETIKAACERYLERVVEGCVDLAFMIIKEKNLESPSDDIGAFSSLAKVNIIDNNLAKKLQHAKRMRNIIIHLYGEIDDEKVFNSLSEELEDDINEFLEKIKGSL